MTVDGRLPRRIETVVVGAGHAGLSVSALLREAGREHLVLERRETLGGGWQDRWDEFCLVSPNWTASFPGFPYEEPDRAEFMPRDRLVARLRRYAEVISAPVVLGTSVERLERRDDGAPGFRVGTSRGSIDADRVVVATGAFQVPRVPAAAAGLSPEIASLHSHAYRNERGLPPGGVLIVGSGQTGVQLAEELQAAGRRVVLSTGRCGWVPRRYRGRDFFEWLWAVRTEGASYGVGLPTAAELPDPRARFACNPALSGHDGGHDTNPRRLAAGGITLAGRFAGAAGTRVRFEPDLAANLAGADRAFDDRLRWRFDRYIEAAGIDAKPDDREPFDVTPPEMTELDLATEGISTVIWAAGYAFDFGWLGLPILDEFGLPRQVDGITEVPGLAFVGLPWMRDQASATLFGAPKDAAVVVERLEAARGLSAGARPADRRRPRPGEDAAGDGW